MTYHDQWQSISNRIQGLEKALEIFSILKGQDHYPGMESIYQEALDIIENVKSYKKYYEGQLPDKVINSIHTFLENSQIKPATMENYKKFIKGVSFELLGHISVIICAFDKEMAYLLSDTGQRVRVLSERAFAHLNRSIVADESICLKWKKAFEKGEVACEKLGAIHLLQHGIFAFKAHAAGERTDLIFQDTMTDKTDVSYAEGLVLTEWKKCPDKMKAEDLFLEARNQAKIYGNGSLSGIELSDYRYLVVVSEKNIEVPAPITENGVTYKHINIAVDPDTPSKASRA